ncbi:MAG: winged helix-turn-helix transcriptional regulator [Candidatus Nanopelagicales bacterium]
MTTLLLLTHSPRSSAEILPALALLNHQVKVMTPEISMLVDAPPAQIILMDAKQDLPLVKSFCRLMHTTGLSIPVILITTEGGLVAITAEWGVDDVILATAGPAEVEARIRLALGRYQIAQSNDATEITTGDLVINENSYVVKLRGKTLDLTFKEFELLKFLAAHPGRVFTRAQLLSEVWGYDYFGGTRTVDVHIRRLRAKLGNDHESLITTVRNVGYRFMQQKDITETTKPAYDYQ